VYDPATNSWKLLKPMPTARSGMAVAVLDEKIFAFGGERLGGTFNQSEVYDPATNTWSVLTPMPMSVHGTCAVTIGETIYIPAGGDSEWRDGTNKRQSGVHVEVGNLNLLAGGESNRKVFPPDRKGSRLCVDVAHARVRQ